MSALGYRRVIRALRKRTEMNLIDRLKIRYKERYLEHFDKDLWNEEIEKAWPKLLALVDAAKAEYDPLPACDSIDGHGMGGYCDCKRVVDEKKRREKNKRDALAALEKE